MNFWLHRLKHAHQDTHIFKSSAQSNCLPLCGVGVSSVAALAAHFFISVAGLLAADYWFVTAIPGRNLDRNPHIWSEEVSSATKMACANQCDDSAVCLANTARKVTYEVLHTNTTFDGFFLEGCYENYVPRSALSFVRTVWDNSNIKQQTNNPVAQSSITID